MKVVKLGEVCRLRNGYAFKSENFANQGVPVMRISDIQDNLVSPENSERVVYETIFENYRIVKGDILIAMSGATTGKFGVYNSNEDAFQNQRVGCFKIIDSKVIYQKYLLFVLHIAKPIIERKANGGAQPNISASSIEEIEIPLPTLEDQIRIATILSKVETLIKQRKESIALLDEFLKSTFLKMFGDPVRNDKGWEVSNMNDISLQITDGEHTTPLRADSGIKLLSARNIKNGYIDFDAGLDYIGFDEYLRISKRCSPERDDILMSCSGSVGRVSIIEVNEPLSLVRSVALIKLKKQIVNPLYIQSWMQSNHFQNEVRRGAKTSSQSNIFTGAIKKLPVLIPPINLQTEFSSIVKRTNILKIQYQQSLKELEGLFGSLSQKAFKGELDLSKMDVFYEGVNSSLENDTTLKNSFEVHKIKEEDIKDKKVKSKDNSNTIQQKKVTNTIQKLNDSAVFIKNKNNDALGNINWESTSVTKIAKFIKNKYWNNKEGKSFNFSAEMLYQFLVSIFGNSILYYTTKELIVKKNISEDNTLKSFIDSALFDADFPIKFDQIFYNSITENFNLELLESDFEIIKSREKEKWSGIYFKIV